MFVSRDWFNISRGFPVQAIMEDIALSRSLKQLAPPVCLNHRLITTSRRWERDGVVRTVVLKMWYLRAAYYIGVPTERLARQYE